MPVERFFLPVKDIIQGSTLTIEDSEFHHLAHVLRGKTGDSIEVVNGNGILSQAEILSMHRNHAELRVLAVEKHAKPRLTLILAQALLRPQKLDWIIEKGTELGVSAFWLFPAERSERKLLATNHWDRLQHIAISALKQSGRLYLPEILLKPPLTEWNQSGIWYGDVKTTAPSIHELLKASSPSIFCVGPESGFTENELRALEKQNAQGVCLNKLTLRAETAAIAASSILASYLS